MTPGKRKTIEVLIPGPFSPLRDALSSCAIEGNQLAMEILETMRRVERGEPVGEKYARQINEFLRRDATAGAYLGKGGPTEIGAAPSVASVVDPVCG